MMRKFLISLAITTILVTPAFAVVNILKEDHPDRYTVVKGDTLWDISSMFLTDAWLWPDIWQINPDIENPHLIYPDDIIILTFRDGQPTLTVERGDQARTDRMSSTDSAGSAGGAGGAGSANWADRDATQLVPRVRVTSISSAIPAIPLDAISSLLTKGRIVAEGTLENAPYILAGRSDRLIFGPGDDFYARGTTWDSHTSVYGIYRKGSKYVDPETRDVLGYEAIEVGLGQVLKRDGDMYTFSLNSVKEDVRIGDRLLPTEESSVESTFYPSAPKNQINGVIMNVLGGVTQVGRNDVIVINRGENEGLTTGNILAINKSGKKVRDRFAQSIFRRRKVQLPSERAGLCMVFRIFDRMSYALVLKTQEGLRVGDGVTNP
jgi:hypothetical protein